MTSTFYRKRGNVWSIAARPAWPSSMRRLRPVVRLSVPLPTMRLPAGCLPLAGCLWRSSETGNRRHALSPQVRP